MRHVILSFVLGIVLIGCSTRGKSSETPTVYSTNKGMISQPSATESGSPSPTLPVTLTPLPSPTSTPDPSAEIYVAIPFSLSDEAIYQQALEDIETYRKGDYALTIIDTNGKPLEGYFIDYRQISHDFTFSVFDVSPYYLTYLTDLGINGFQSNLWWSFVELELGSYRLSFVNRFKGIEEIASSGLSFYAQDVFSASDTYPLLTQVTFAEQEDAIQEHLVQLVTRFADDVDIWEAFLEPEYTFNNPHHWSRQQYLELIKLSEDVIRKYDPTAQISINQSVPCDPTQRQKIIDVLEFGVEFDILGLQFYYNSFTNPIYEFQAPRLTLEQINRCLDYYGALLEPYGVLIGASETSLPSEAPSWVPGYASQPWSQDLQAQYFEYLATIIFSKPYSTGINWFKAIDEPGGFILNGGLVDYDLNPKKSYFTYQNLIRRWTTNGRVDADNKGRATIRGYGGTYELIIRDPAMEQQMITQIHLYENEQRSLEIVFEPQNPLIDELERLELFVQYWEKKSNQIKVQSGRDYLALIEHHLGLNELALAQQTYNAAINALSIPYNFTLRGDGDLSVASYGRDKPIIDQDRQVIWSADTLFFPFDFPKGEAIITVYASASGGGGVWPHMVIGVGSHYSEILEVNKATVGGYTFQTRLTGQEEVLTIRYPEEDCPNIGECKLFILSVDVQILSEELPLPPDQDRLPISKLIDNHAIDAS